jgi:membrane-bound lytic murein transglycosylase F
MRALYRVRYLLVLVATAGGLCAIAALVQCASPSHEEGAAADAPSEEARASGDSVTETNKELNKERILNVARNDSGFNAHAWLESDRTFAARPLGTISKYDHIIKKMARRYGFDWRLIAAQIYVESNFRNNATSPVGATGLMQIMPSTAQFLGADPGHLIQPEVNIALGVRYDQRMYSLWRRQLEKNPTRLAFALASYNAGRGRVLRSYRKFLDSDSIATWSEVYKDLPRETELYVHKVFLKYDMYKKHVMP